MNQQKRKYATEVVFHTHNKFFDDLHPKIPFQSQRRRFFPDFVEEIDSGERPNTFPKRKMPVRLQQYQLPPETAAVLNLGLKPVEDMPKRLWVELNNIKNLLGEEKGFCLTPANYTKVLNLLLYMEEHQMHHDIRLYDREEQTLKPEGQLLELEVPGLAEHRPSVIYGDAVYLKESRESTKEYQGFVHAVRESSVLLKFSQGFMSSVFMKGKKFHVRFTFNRYPIRVEHQAVDFTRIDNISHLFFPKRIQTAPLTLKQLNWFNKDIAGNPQQQQAVQAILNKTSKPSPYLIFGPPGTGKTVTVVEAVKQIRELTNENVLICTPSNNAANEVTRRLITSIPTTDLYRFIAKSFPYHSIPENIKKYSNFATRDYDQPLMSQLVKYRIVVTTLTSAAKLVNDACPEKHFGYVFIDEAGQATESETLVSIARILSKNGSINGQVVLAGDPKQLGPVIHSALAKSHGFDISMLERLMGTCEPYKKNPEYNPNALTKLLKNYRSHPVIVNQPNHFFYDDELEVAGDHLINLAVGSDVLPNGKFPLIFHSVLGVHQREDRSPSWFNVQEVQIVIKYLDELIGSKMQGRLIKDEDVGVVTPYKRQVEKIRQACRKKKYGDKLFVGSVEQFQGQERLIIIISTVRSKSDMLQFDRKFHLGFLDNPKRFNVAVTRAKALLIVIGNPNVLQIDKHWRGLIQYCQENKAVVGDKFSLEPPKTETEETPSDNKALTVETDQEEVPSFSRGVH